MSVMHVCCCSVWCVVLGKLDGCACVVWVFVCLRELCVCVWWLCGVRVRGQCGVCGAASFVNEAYV